MNSISRLLFSIIFTQPLPPEFDQELASEVYKSSSTTLLDSLALRQILITWLNRTPEVEETVRKEILQQLKNVIDENIKGGEKAMDFSQT